MTSDPKKNQETEELKEEKYSPDVIEEISVFPDEGSVLISFKNKKTVMIARPFSGYFLDALKDSPKKDK